MVYRKLSEGSQRAITRAKVRKLQRAGLLSSKIDANAKPSKFVLSKLYKYRSLISGKQAAVKLASADAAAALRNKVGEGGERKVVIVPREKGEKFFVKGNTVKSTRFAYGQTIEKTIGDKFRPPREGERVYYTLPRRVPGLSELKRRTFASFDEMIASFEKYEVSYEDIEDYIEVERVKQGSRTQKRVAKEYHDARARLERVRIRKRKLERARKRKVKLAKIERVRARRKKR